MTPKVPTMEMGTVTLGITVAARLRKKRNITSTTSATVSTSENCTSATEARIVVVRSVRMATLTEAGRAALSWGNSALMRSATWMMLAPGWRCTLTMTAGRSFFHAASRTFSTPSSTRATSDRRTGAPFL